MTTNTETALNQVDIPVDLTTRESATVKENRTLKMLWHSYVKPGPMAKNHQRPFLAFLRSQVSDPPLLKSRYLILSSFQGMVP
ncbi:hypothetical protein KY284_023896 [Solanum tuberosum]|nr:hypothetical protein KY284_023896 [Solanum tuberosum]